MAAAFCCLLSFLLFRCMFNTSLGHIRFSCLDVCFIIFGWSYLLWIQIRKIAKNLLIKNRSEIRQKFYTKLGTFMKNCDNKELCLRNDLFEWFPFLPKFALASVLFELEQFSRAELMGEINELIQVSWWYFAWIYFVSSNITCILTEQWHLTNEIHDIIKIYMTEICTIVETLFIFTCSSLLIQ